MAHCYKQLAKCYEGVSLYHSAIEVLTEATQIVKGQQLADMYESCADCYKLLQQYDSAAMLMQKACNVPHLPEEKRNELMIERVTFDVALNHKKTLLIARTLCLLLMNNRCQLLNCPIFMKLRLCILKISAVAILQTLIGNKFLQG